jgi:uncharacterized protein with PIN domain
MSKFFRRIFHRCSNHLEPLIDFRKEEYRAEGFSVTFENFHVRFYRCEVCGKITAVKVPIKPV